MIISNNYINLHFQLSTALNGSKISFYFLTNNVLNVLRSLTFIDHECRESVGNPDPHFLALQRGRVDLTPVFWEPIDRAHLPAHEFKHVVLVYCCECFLYVRFGEHFLVRARGTEEP